MKSFKLQVQEKIGRAVSFSFLMNEFFFNFRCEKD